MTTRPSRQPLTTGGAAPSWTACPGCSWITSTTPAWSIDGPSGLLAFLIGILSPADPRQAYVHFAGVAPQARRQGLAELLYTEFFALARAEGRTTVSAVTAPVNTGSIAFHRAMGFSVTGPVADYNGPGRDLVRFDRAL